MQHETRNHLIIGHRNQKRYALAGKARFTIRSLNSGKHWVYQVHMADDRRVWFVHQLTDGGVRRPVYVGRIRRSDLAWLRAHRAASPAVALSGEVFAWWWSRVVSERLFRNLEVHGSGVCARCGLELTDPASTQRGIGPVCHAHVRTILDVRPRLAALADALDADGFAAPLWEGSPSAVRAVDAHHLSVMLRHFSAGGVDEVAQVLHLLRSLELPQDAVRHLGAVAGALAVHAEGDKAARKALRDDLKTLAPPRLTTWWLPNDAELEAVGLAA